MNVSDHDDDGEDGNGAGAAMHAGEGAAGVEISPEHGGAIEASEGEGGAESVEDEGGEEVDKGEGGEKVHKGEGGDVVEGEGEREEAAASDELPTLPYPPSSIPLDKAAAGPNTKDLDSRANRFLEETRWSQF